MSERILLVQLADIGDLILTTPSLHALREALPQAHLALLTTAHAAPVLPAGLVDEVLTLDRRQFSSLAFFRPANLRRLLALRRGAYEAVVFFHHVTLRLGALKFALIARACGARRVIGLDNGQAWFLTEAVPDEGFGAQHQAAYWLKLVALLGADSAPRRAQAARHQGILPLSATTQRRIVVHGGSGGYNAARRWSPLGFAAVADALAQEFQAQIVLVGTTDDAADQIQRAMRQPCHNLAGKTSLPQLADLLRSADLFIGADSGVMHLAVAVGTPTVALFGPSNHDAWRPWTLHPAQVRLLRAESRCSPCAYVGHRLGARDGCPERTCMSLIRPQQVIQAARDLLRNRPAPPEPAPRPISPPSDPDAVRLLGFAHPRLTLEGWIDRLLDIMGRGGLQQVVFTHADLLLQAQEDAVLRVVLGRAAALVPCGGGLSWAASWRHRLLPQIIHPHDLLALLLQRAAYDGWRTAIIGQSQAIVEGAQQTLRAALPSLRLVGGWHGAPDASDEACLCEALASAHPDLLLVGFPAPLAEKWIARNAPRLSAGLALGVGHALRDWADMTPLPPAWMTRLGVGWLYDALREPRRLRALWRVPRFVWAVVTARWRRSTWEG
ncbi:MAG: WecB/TagA/CpsF family glycosyltransferase [Anaerolineae bacterium]|nr:WecB/TagA/CpsF family glycosyltransferase [Anaerolineae bacterium]MDW8172290.1 WecB/TagA/CpsF family glycosyltransferase [Anaerolineae bacterium]